MTTPPPPRRCHHPGCDRHPVLGTASPTGVTWWCRKHYPNALTQP